MLLTAEQKRREQKNRNKARVGSSLLMLLLLLFIVMPFMSMSILDSELARKKQRKQIVINFSKEKVQKFEEARSQLSQAAPLAANPVTTAASSSPPPAAAPEPVPAPAQPTAKRSAAPAPTKLPAAAAKPLLTSPISKMPSLPSLPKLFGKKKSKKPVEQALPDEETGEEELAVAAGGGEGDPAEKTGTGTDKNSKADAGRGTSDGGGSTSNPSDGLGGTGDKPSNGTEGTGKGDGPGAGPGEGEGEGAFGAFGRKRIFAPSSAGLVKKDGKVTLKICVNQDGKVTYAKAMEEGTTFYDEEILENAEQLMKKYRFAKDYTAPEKQCGKYAFIVYPE